jgi:hypothetical protein
MYEETYDRALRLKRFPLRVVSDADHPRTEVTTAMLAFARANRKLGNELAQAGDPSAAEPYLRKSLEILANTEVEWSEDIDWKERIGRVARKNLQVVEEYLAREIDKTGEAPKQKPNE